MYSGAGLETGTRPMPPGGQRTQNEVPVKSRPWLLCMALAASSSFTVLAQQMPTGYHNVVCLKVKAENGSEYRKWAAGDLHKFAQARVDSGSVSTWFLLSSVMPQGTSAGCDYLIIAMYPGAPPKPLSVEELDSLLKKAGISATAQEFMAHRASVGTMVSNNLFQNKISVGAVKKGDYFIINELKVSDMEGYLDYAKKVWQPFAEELAKGGVRTGWSMNVEVLPSGSDLRFQAVTVDIFPSWEAVYQDQQLSATFKRVHPDMEVGTTLEKAAKLRTIVSSELFHVEDMISSAK